MSFNDRTISGVKWTTISTIVIAVAGLLKIAVLARFLEPSAFGLMALVNFVLGFMQLFMDMGLTSAILHKQDISQKEYASLYWINVVFSFLIFGIISLLSPFIAGFYQESELAILIPIIAITIIFSALGRQFKTIEQKELNFRYIALTDIVGSFFGMVVGIVLAVRGFGVYSLVYASLTQYGIANIIYFLRGIIDRGLIFHFNYKETKPFLKIGIYQVGSQVVNYFNRDIDILLIGKMFGADILGGYDLAKQLVKRPMQILNPIVTKVASPVLAKLQTDKTKLKNKFLSFLNVVSTANFTAYSIVALFAYPIVYIIYGTDFLNIVIIVQILSGYMYLRSISNPIGSLVIATGRTDVEFYWNLIVLFITPIVVWVGAQYSIVMVAILLVLVTLGLTILMWKLIIKKLTEATFKEFLTKIIPNWKNAYNQVFEI